MENNRKKKKHKQTRGEESYREHSLWFPAMHSVVTVCSNCWLCVRTKPWIRTSNKHLVSALFYSPLLSSKVASSVSLHAPCIIMQISLHLKRLDRCSTNSLLTLLSGNTESKEFCTNNDPLKNITSQGKKYAWKMKAVIMISGCLLIENKAS